MYDSIPNLKNFLGLILYITVNNFLGMSRQVFLGLSRTKQRLKCLAQRHNAVPPVREKIIKEKKSQTRYEKVNFSKDKGKLIVLYERQDVYSKTCLKRPLKNRQNKDLNGKWLINEDRKYCRMLPLEHSAMLLTCIKRYLVLKTNFCVIFEWPLKTGFTVSCMFIFSTLLCILPVT